MQTIKVLKLLWPFLAEKHALSFFYYATVFIQADVADAVELSLSSIILHNNKAQIKKRYAAIILEQRTLKVIHMFKIKSNIQARQVMQHSLYNHAHNA